MPEVQSARFQIIFTNAIEVKILKLNLMITYVQVIGVTIHICLIKMENKTGNVKEEATRYRLVQLSCENVTVTPEMAVRKKPQRQMEAQPSDRSF